MAGVLDGVRILEVAAWTFVPAAGAICADLGADVIKVEPPTGDPQRALQNIFNSEVVGPNPFDEIPNRGKRSLTLDLRNEAGREVLLAVARTSDVFLTSYLPSLRRRLRIDVADLREANPDIIYVRGSGWGSRGPMADAGGYDLASAWATSGLAYRLVGRDGPAPQPPAFFDLMGGNTLAGSIGMALFRRERTGKTSVVDVSLMNVGMWAMAPDIVSAPYVDSPAVQSRETPGNPLVNWYRCADGRWLYLVLLQADRFWSELCVVLDEPALAEDPRFADAASRFEHRSECVSALDAAFATRPLAQWQERFERFSGVWAPVTSPRELHAHRQVEPNGYLPELVSGEGVDFRIVASPMHFDEQPTAPGAACPELGQHNEQVLLEVGLEWDAIGQYREKGAFG